jgi:hypothetical protein
LTVTAETEAEAIFTRRLAAADAPVASRTVSVTV